MDKNKAIEMIVKMARVTEDAGAFEGEIANASARIQLMMEKYAIEQWEIDTAKADEQEKQLKMVFESQVSDYKHHALKKWNWDLARLIARITGTRNYASGKHMVFFGVPNAAKTAAELYILWLGNIEEIASKQTRLNIIELEHKYPEFAGKPKFRENVSRACPQDNPKYFRTSWIDGCIGAMFRKVMEQEVETETKQHHPHFNGVHKGSEDAARTTPPRTNQQSNALALYKAEVEKAYTQMAKGFRHVNTHASKGFSHAGYNKGNEFGSSVSIGSKPLSAGAKRLKK